MTTEETSTDSLRLALEHLDWWVPMAQQSGFWDGKRDVAQLTAARITDDGALSCIPLGDLLPGLERCGGRPSEYIHAVRTWNILMRCSRNEWSELAALSTQSLRIWPSAGRVVVADIVAGALRAWEEGRRAPDGSVVVADVPTPPPAVAHAALRRLCVLAFRDGAQTVREAIELATRDEDIASKWAEFGGIQLVGFLELVDAFEPAWTHLLEFDERERRILESRVLTTLRPLTLDEIGTEFGITRERVRQIEKRVRERLELRYVSELCGPLQHLVARCRRMIGALATGDFIEGVLADLVPDDVPDRGLRHLFLLFQAGPYRAVDGVWEHGSALEELKADLASCAEGLVSHQQLDDILEARDVRTTQAELVIRRLLRPVEGGYLVWSGSLNDRAARLLRLHGEPMSRDELHAAMGSEDVNVASLMNAIKSDERFSRVGRNSYALSAWGGETYTTIADQIERAIERHGGRAALDTITSELESRFGLAASSIRAYASSRRFKRESNGDLVLAARGLVPPAQMPPELDRDLIRRRGMWCLRVVVDIDVLRGSGRMIRVAVAQAAGLQPGERREFRLADGETVVMSWQRDQPSLGSIRRSAEHLRAADGDLLFVPLADGKRVWHVRSSDLANADGLERLALELGIKSATVRAASSATQLDAISSALGFERATGAGELKARLVARRQPELGRLIPLHSGNGNDDALAELMDLGG